MYNGTLFDEPKSPTYCPYCGKRGIHFKYAEIVAECFTCKEEIYVPFINDYNCESREYAYNAAKARKDGESDERTD